MMAKHKTRPQRYHLSEFDRKLLIRIRFYAIHKDIHIWRAFEELCRKGLLYDAEHELRFLQDKILAKSTNFFAKILYLAKLEAEAKKTKDYVIVKENKGSFIEQYDVQLCG